MEQGSLFQSKADALTGRHSGPILATHTHTHTHTHTPNNPLNAPAAIVAVGIRKAVANGCRKRSALFAFPQPKTALFPQAGGRAVFLFPQPKRP